MSIALISSLLAFLAAAAISLSFLREKRGWRLSFLTAMLIAMAVPAILRLREQIAGGGSVVLGDGTDLQALLVSVLALTAVISLYRVSRESTRAQKALQVEVAHHEQLFQHSPQAVVLLDNDDTVQRVNTQFTAIFGYEAAEAVDRKINDLIVPEHLKGEGSRLTTEVASGQTVRATTVRCRKDGSLLDVSILGAPITLEDNRVAVYGIYRDITTSKLAEEALFDSEERYDMSARGAYEGLWDWNLLDDKILFSFRWKEMLGYEEHDISDDPEEWFSRVHPNDLDRLNTELAAHLAGLTPHFECEYRIRNKTGSYLWMFGRAVSVRREGGRPTRMAGSQSDITDLKLIEEQLQHDAFHDALTGLPNRSLMLDRLSHSLRKTRRRGVDFFAVIVIDLDRFKVVNDSLGHSLGDQLLVRMGQHLEQLVRPGDTLARIGGDEFVILAENIEAMEGARTLAERVRTAVSEPMHINGHEVVTTASIGMVLASQGQADPADLLRDADLALYRAKDLGGNRFEVFESRMRVQALHRLELEWDLRKAVEEQKLAIYYQPIFSPRLKQITGFEALARWAHPVLGMVSPEEFIPIAEETDLIVEIGQWVLREACQQLSEWRELYSADLTMSVNLSARQMARSDLVDQIEMILRECHLDPALLGLEITERLIVDETGPATKVLAGLRSLGARIEIDDFGTGYSSLGYLHRLPVDGLKIDRSFVAKMGPQGENSGIIRSIITMALDLNVTVIAEGVETAGQLAKLEEFGCHYVQGHFLGKALDVEAVATLLSTRRPAPSSAVVGVHVAAAHGTDHSA